MFEHLHKRFLYREHSPGHTTCRMRWQRHATDTAQQVVLELIPSCRAIAAALPTCLSSVNDGPDLQIQGGGIYENCRLRNGTRHLFKTHSKFWYAWVEQRREDH